MDRQTCCHTVTSLGDGVKLKFELPEVPRLRGAADRQPSRDVGLQGGESRTN